MRDGATVPERAHVGTCRRDAKLRPLHVERAAEPVECGADAPIEFVQLCIRRGPRVFKVQDELQQARCPCRWLGMANIRLDTAECT